MSDTGASFVWDDLAGWGDIIPSHIPVSIRSALMASMRRRQAGFRYCDDGWFVKGFYSEVGNYSAIIDSLTSHLVSEYGFVRMFHCCRPTCIESYYRSGIRVLDFDYANANFRELVLSNPRFSHVSIDHLESAFTEMLGSYMRNGYVHFGLDKRFLTKHGSHYLKAGSEYLQALASRVDSQANTNIAGYLKSIGTPTVFVVNIPIPELTSDEMNSLSSSMLTTWTYNYAHQSKSAYEIDFGISLDADLPPSLIVNHFHPDVD